MIAAHPTCQDGCTRGMLELQKLFVNLYYVTTFREDRIRHFKIINILSSCQFGVKMPIHAPFWMFWGSDL